MANIAVLDLRGTGHEKKSKTARIPNVPMTSDLDWQESVGRKFEEFE
jgi:hypothetical protein